MQAEHLRAARARLVSSWHPKVRAAAGFHSRTRPVGEVTITADAMLARIASALPATFTSPARLASCRWAASASIHTSSTAARPSIAIRSMLMSPPLSSGATNIATSVEPPVSQARSGPPDVRVEGGDEQVAGRRRIGCVEHHLHGDEQAEVPDQRHRLEVSHPAAHEQIEQADARYPHQRDQPREAVGDRRRSRGTAERSRSGRRRASARARNAWTRSTCPVGTTGDRVAARWPSTWQVARLVEPGQPSAMPRHPPLSSHHSAEHMKDDQAAHSSAHRVCARYVRRIPRIFTVEEAAIAGRGAAVDRPLGAGDVGGLVGREERDDRRRSPRAARCDRAAGLGERRLVRLVPRHPGHRRVDAARVHRVDADAVLAELERAGLRQAAHRPLARQYARRPSGCPRCRRSRRC